MIASVEALRVVAVAGVMWFHLENAPFAAVGQAGLVAFVLLCTTFQSIAAERETLRAYLHRRSQRLGPPWLAWFALYSAANLLRGREWFPWSEGMAANLLTGPWIGLWFLPFVWLMSPVVFLLTRWTAPGPPEASIPLLLTLAGLLLLIAAWLPLLRPIPTPWAQWLHAAPTVPLALALRYTRATDTTTSPCRPAVVMAVWLGICLPILWIQPETATSHALGAAACAAAFGTTLPLPPAITRLGALCLGVYLIHPAVMAALKYFPPLRSHPIGLFAAAVPTCFGLVHLLRHVRWLRPVL